MSLDTSGVAMLSELAQYSYPQFIENYKRTQLKKKEALEAIKNAILDAHQQLEAIQKKLDAQREHQNRIASHQDQIRKSLSPIVEPSCCGTLSWEGTLAQHALQDTMQASSVSKEALVLNSASKTQSVQILEQINIASSIIGTLFADEGAIELPEIFRTAAVSCKMGFESQEREHDFKMQVQEKDSKGSFQCMMQQHKSEKREWAVEKQHMLSEFTQEKESMRNDFMREKEKMIHQFEREKDELKYELKLKEKEWQLERMREMEVRSFETSSLNSTRVDGFPSAGPRE